MRTVKRSVTYTTAIVMTMSFNFASVPTSASEKPNSSRARDEIVDAPSSGYAAAEPNHVPAALDDTDALATLDGIRIALNEVGDGGTYVWHRRDGVLSGMAQPTASYKDPNGQPCRNLIVMLNTYGRSSRIDGVACRTAAGRWELAG